jgi:hypothetical protein
VATNHQESIEWPEQAQFSRTLERERFLRERLADSNLSERELIKAFLASPLYNTAYSYGFGTLYTAVYRPDRGEAEFHWPAGSWTQSFHDFQEGTRVVRYAPLPETNSRPEFGSWGQEGNHGKERLWTDTPWGTDDHGVNAILRQAFLRVLETLEASGSTVPAALRDEFMEDMDRAGHVPWEKLGAIWTDPTQQSRKTGAAVTINVEVG